MAIIIKVQVQTGNANSSFKRMNDNAEKLKKNVEAINQKLKVTVGLSDIMATNFERAASAFNSMRAGGIRMPRGGSSGGGGTARQPKTTGQKVADLFMRSRVDAKGNMMPLIMDIAKILGPEATVAIGAALTAGKVFATVLNDASEALMGWRISLATGGGTAGEARAVGRLSQFTGADVGGIGRGLMSGYGPIAAAGAGVNPFGGPFGDMNYNEKGLKVLDYIRNAKNFNQARQRAELAGSPESASVYQLSQGTYNKLRSAETGSATMANMRAQAEMQANLIILKDSFAQLEVAVAGPVIKDVATLLSGITQVFDLLNRAGGLVGPAVQGVENMIPGLRQLIQILEMLGMIGGGSNGHKQSLEDNTEALNKNTQMMKEGLGGGGPNAQSAIPARMQPNNPSGYQVRYGIPA